MPEIPRILIAGTQSGVGKTSLTLGIVLLLRSRGLRVQTFKVGPDYLDPTYLAVASGRPCYNLDGWMTGRPYIESLFSRATADADIAVIEGAMGLFDGADPVSEEGSCAQIAKWLNAPVVLVLNAHGMARSVAALVHGYSSFDRGLRIAGVIANHCGSDRHARWLRDSLEALPARFLGAVTRGGLPQLASRHLGLVTANPGCSSQLNQLSDALASVLDLDGVLRSAQLAPHWQPVASLPSSPACQQYRLGIARDDAFHFYYLDNLEALERAGCEIVPFSPLSDSRLPDNLNGLYFGGGYPEEFAEALSLNACIREQIRLFSGLIYAECGGLMYLAEGIETRNGKRYPQTGLMPGWVRMENSRKALGYVEVTLAEPTFLGKRGDVLRGHEYHYSELVTQPNWQRAYRVRKRRSDEIFAEGFQRGSILASYIHLHFASRPEAVKALVQHLGAR